MWISGPITTVQDEHICDELAAVARVGLSTRRWLSDKSRNAAVVLGNHPISVGKMQTAVFASPWTERVRSAAGATPFLGGRSEAMVRSKRWSLFVANCLPRRRISVFLLLSRRNP
jgi:hypothetical protein